MKFARKSKEKKRLDYLKDQLKFHASAYGRKGDLVTFSRMVSGKRKQKSWEELLNHTKVLISQRRTELI